ncbi:mitochondrial 37S ribosomal protein uS13m [Limtongia smithiae]|uniref:mitochondrial 37S ribosomal protein uS13m n=1 Tax=Limtongia smithiae TaxID=1125753 RepID=UPI0034CD9E6B
MRISFEGKSFRGNALVRLALEYKFYGLGKVNAERICARLGFYPYMRMHQLTEPDFMALSKELSGFVTGADKRQLVLDNIMAKRAIGTYVGRRYALGYPVYGQRTKNNGATARRLNRIQWRKYTTEAGAAEVALVRTQNVSTSNMTPLIASFFSATSASLLHRFRSWL